MGLSANSVSAIFGKLRRFMCDIGAFSDFNEWGIEHAVYRRSEAAVDYEIALYEFHRQRLSGKRRLVDPPEGPLLHFAETCWRFHYYLMWKEQKSDWVYAIMLRHLFELIDRYGPIGVDIQKRRPIFGEHVAQLDQIEAWLKRYGRDYDDEILAAIRPIRIGLLAPRTLVIDKLKSLTQINTSGSTDS